MSTSGTNYVSPEMGLAKEEQDALFARFLDPSRKRMPDIDRDFYRPRRWALRLKWESWVQKFKIFRAGR